MEKAIENYARILVLLTEVVANPTKAGIDSIVSAASSSGIMTPKVTNSVDGESYSWGEYQSFIVDKLTQLQQVQQRLSGPFWVTNYAR